MKKKLWRMWAVILLCCLLSACTEKGSSKDLSLPEFSKPVASDSASDEALTSSSEHEEEEPEADETATDCTAYLKIEQIETDLGIIQIPTLFTDKIPGNNAVLAEAMFRSIEDKLYQDARDVKAYYDEQGYEENPDLRYNYLCESKAALNDNVLSVLVYYSVLSPTAPSLWFYEGVNIDIKTGDTIPSMKLVEMAGYAEGALYKSISYYCTNAEELDDYGSYFLELSDQGQLPDFTQAPPQVFPMGDRMAINSLTEKPEPTGEAWDALDRFPITFYEGPDHVSVCVKIEYPVDIGYYWKAVRLAVTYPGLVKRNPTLNIRGFVRRFPMTPEEAIDAVAWHLGMDEDSVTYTLKADSLQNLQYHMNAFDDGYYDVFYVIPCCISSSDSVPLAIYGVNPFDGCVIQQNPETGEWSMLPFDTAVIDTSFLYSEEAENSIAVINGGLCPFEVWSQSPYEYFNAVPYTVEEGSDYETNGVYIFPMKENARFTLIAGQYLNGVFEEMNEIFTESMEAEIGHYLCYEKLDMDANSPSLAFRIENSKGSALYILGENTGENKLIYLKPEY